MRAALTLAFAASPLAAQDPDLAQPIDCTLGETCYIQNYVDTLSATGRAADFACGTLTYDTHKGTDFALPTLADLATNVTVQAAAAGIVRTARDGMPDTGLDGDIENRECGNGVLLDHGNGWATQYCHLKHGSVAVRKGDIVQIGTPLGQVGFSGRTEFPHLHFELRHHSDVIDPFDPDETATCSAAPDALWADPIPYVSTALLGAGFSPDIPDFKAVKSGTAGHATLAEGSPALVLWGYMFGQREGDSLTFTITGPDGFSFQHEAILKRTQALSMRAAGKRLRTQAWPRGTYQGTVTLTRKGQILSSATAQVALTQ